MGMPIISVMAVRLANRGRNALQAFALRPVYTPDIESVMDAGRAARPPFANYRTQADG